jgi:hypothetical protein
MAIKWNFTSVSGIMDKGAWAQITLSLKGGWEHSKNFSFDFVHCMERMPIFVTVGMSILAQYMTTILLIY